MMKMVFLMFLIHSIPIFNKKSHEKLQEWLFSFLCKSFLQNISSRLAEGLNISRIISHIFYVCWRQNRRYCPILTRYIKFTFSEQCLSFPIYGKWLGLTLGSTFFFFKFDITIAKITTTPTTKRVLNTTISGQIVICVMTAVLFRVFIVIGAFERETKVTGL